MQDSPNPSGQSLLAAFLVCRSGATAIEYALVASLIAAVIVGAVSAFGDGVGALFDQIVAGFSA